MAREGEMRNQEAMGASDRRVVGALTLEDREEVFAKCSF